MANILYPYYPYTSLLYVDREGGVETPAWM